MKRTYTLTITIDEQIAEEYNKLAANYQKLTPQEYQDFDFLADAVLDTDNLLVPADDTSIIHWLPVNGTVPPERYHSYLLTDGEVTREGITGDGRVWFGTPYHYQPTHYAELPTFEPVQIIADVVCDGCGQAFTAEQWEKRYTPHEADCPCFDVDFADSRGDFACTCDRNFHVGCYTDELREQDNNTCDMLRVLHPDRYAYAEEAE